MLNLLTINLDITIHLRIQLNKLTFHKVSKIVKNGTTMINAVIVQFVNQRLNFTNRLEIKDIK